MQSGPQDFVARMLDKDPKTRITMQGILQHPWLSSSGALSTEGVSKVELSQGDLDDAVTSGFNCGLAKKMFDRLSERERQVYAYFSNAGLIGMVWHCGI